MARLITAKKVLEEVDTPRFPPTLSGGSCLRVKGEAA